MGRTIAVVFAVFVISSAAVHAQPVKVDTPPTVWGPELISESNPKSSIDQGAVVILGASYVLDWPIQEFGRLRVVNKGVSGERSFEMLRRFSDDVVALKPRAVIIWGFNNDIHAAPKQEIEAAMARVRESIEEMVRLARANSIEPILATDVTIRYKDDLWSIVKHWVGPIFKKRSYQEYVNGHVLAVNRWIRKYAAQQQILLLDFEPLFADEKGFRKKGFATEDGTHIPPAAYETLTDHAATVLSTLKKAEKGISANRAYSLGGRSVASGTSSGMFAAGGQGAEN